MPTSLAEALTQLSFLELVQRCNLLIAPSQPTQLPAPISFLDVAVQTAAPCEVSQDASTQTSDQPVSSLSLDVAVQTMFHSIHTSSLNAAVQTLPHGTLSQDVSTQMGSRPAFSFSVDTSMQTSIRSVVQHDAATQLPLTEFFIGWIFSDSPLDRRNHMAATSLTMRCLAWDLGINLLTSLCSFTFATPIFLDPAVLRAVSKHNKEGMSANITDLSVPRNDAHDHAPVHQGVRDASRQDHMSLPRSAVTVGEF